MLETKRLILRDPVMDDVDDFLEYNGNEEFYIYIPMDPQTRESTEEFVRWHIANANNPERTKNFFVITEKGNRKAIGTISIELEDDVKRRGVVGYALNTAYWGKGYMTEVLMRVLDFGFNEMNLKRIYGLADPDNIGTIKVMEKCGMRYEGCHRCEDIIRGEFKDNIYYAILDSDWKNLHDN